MYNDQMRIKREDEQAGRLDYVYETNLTIAECQSRIGNAVSGKLSEYKAEIEDGILYISFIDAYDNVGGLFASTPQKYAVRFESMADKTIIRVRYIWPDGSVNIQYILRTDIDDFFAVLFDASVLEFDNKIWTDETAKPNLRTGPFYNNLNQHFLNKKIIVVLFALIWTMAILQWHSDAYDPKSDYKMVSVNGGSVLVQSEYYYASTRSKGDDYYYLESDECKMLVIALPVDSIDGEFVDNLGLSEDSILQMDEISSEQDLQNLLNVKDKNVIETEHGTDENGVKKHRIGFKTGDKVVCVNVYQKNDGSIAQIIVSDEGFFTDEEIDKMCESLYY